MSNNVIFDQNPMGIIIRNTSMHKHFEELNKIFNRKNQHLPLISPVHNKNKNRNENKIFGLTKDELFFIQRNNKVLVRHLDELTKRKNLISRADTNIDKIIREHEETKNNYKKIKRDLLFNENKKIKFRLSQVKP